MDKTEKIYIASIALGKNYNYETLKYSDYLYGKEEYADEIWEDYIVPAKENGMKWFREEYSEYKLY